MSTREDYPAGVPCWVDTSQPDPADAARFRATMGEGQTGSSMSYRPTIFAQSVASQLDAPAMRREGGNHFLRRSPESAIGAASIMRVWRAHMRVAHGSVQDSSSWVRA